ncbi:MAG: hypothetical protein ACNA7Q_12980 [Rhodobacterales bacterium]
MEQDEILARSDALCALLAEKLSLKKGTLAQRMRRAGRRLPARIRDQAQIVAGAEAMSAHPKLALRIDHAEVDRAFQEVRNHLRMIDPGDRRRGALLGALGALAFNILLFVALLMAFLRWQNIL